MATRDHLYQLIDELPEGEIRTAERFLAYLRDTYASDPLQRLLDEAPEDDEPLTPEEIATIEEGKAAYRRGDYLTAEEAKRELLS